VGFMTNAVFKIRKGFLRRREEKRAEPRGGPAD